MLRLIIREINDRILHFAIVIGLASAIVVMMLFSTIGSTSGQEVRLEGFTLVGLVICVVIFYGFGFAQIQSDRNKKVFAFLSTLAVTRGMMFLSKVIAGLVTIAVFFIPVSIAIQFVIRRYMSPMSIQSLAVTDMLWSVFFISLTAYGLGLVVGWGNGKIIPTLGGLFLTLLFYSIVVIKGIHLGDLLPVVAPVIISCFVIAYRKFMAASF
ncbi:MAG: hypothetical protein K8R02_04100 [Anaerohalosphaeraceae bacterium]|nr:hypothetical protein [Anaerohalosphaeraceae bacterium]